MKIASFLSLAPLIEADARANKKESGGQRKDLLMIHLKNSWLTKPVIKPYAIISLLIPAPHQHAPISRNCLISTVYGAPLFQSSSHEISLVFIDHVVMINFHDPQLTLRLFIEKRYYRSIT